jgi:hypothetical protein
VGGNLVQYPDYFSSCANLPASIQNGISVFVVLRAGKAALITVGGLAVGATVGSAVENWLQVDVVPFLGVHSPAVVVSEFILFSQLLVSLFVR